MLAEHFDELSNQAFFELSMRKSGFNILGAGPAQGPQFEVPNIDEAAKKAVYEHFGRNDGKQDPVTVMHLESVPDTGRSMLPRRETQVARHQIGSTDFGESAIELAESKAAKSKKSDPGRLTLQDIEVFVE